MEPTQYMPATEPSPSPQPQVSFPSISELLTQAWRSFWAIKSTILPLALIIMVIEICLEFLKISAGSSMLQYSHWYSLILGLNFYLPFILNWFFVLTVLITLKHNLSLTSAIPLVLKKIPSAFSLIILILLIITGGIALLLLPGLYYAITLSLALVALVESDSNSILGAIKTSRQLVRGHYWHVFISYLGLVVVCTPLILLIVVVTFILDLTNISNSQTISDLAASFFEFTIALPLTAIFSKHIYDSLLNIKLSGNSFAERPVSFFKLIPFMVLGLVLQSIVFVLGNMSIISRDVPPPELGELEIELIDSSNPGTNAYFSIDSAIKTFNPDVNMEKIYEQLLAGEKYDQTQINQILGTNRQSLQYFDLALSQPYFQPPLIEVSDLGEKSVMAPGDSISTIDAIKLAKLNSIRAFDYMNRGEQKLALETAEKNIALGQKMIDSPNPYMHTILVGLAFKQAGVRATNSLIPTLMDDDVLSPQVVSGYNRYRFEADPFIRYLKTDAVLILEYFDQQKINSDNRHTSQSVYKPEQTKQLYLDHIRKLVEFVEAEDFQGLKEFEENIEIDVKRSDISGMMLQENAAGKLLTQVQVSTINLHKQVEKLQEFDREIDELQQALMSRATGVREAKIKQEMGE